MTAFTLPIQEAVRRSSESWPNGRSRDNGSNSEDGNRSVTHCTRSGYQRDQPHAEA
jgi:hypothetical protein